MVHNGTVDSDYRRIVGVILFTFSNEEYVIERGDRIAQVIIECNYTPKFVEVTKGGWVWFYRSLVLFLSFFEKI